MHSVNCLGQKVAMLHSIAIQRVDHGKYSRHDYNAS